MIKRFRYSSLFEKKLRSYTKEQRQEIIAEIETFAQDPFAIHLRTHPLRPPMAGQYSFSIFPNLLITFRFLKPDHSEVIFYDIGGHEIYK
ncbi:MAG: hypothetical protein G01um101416_586 [Microgenomates group bacterium Gr01-1014_16]|nr:MAG: hypothetical protein G01um101416_586 [Microgenomates group bacterium Gr01-1014_16]